MQAEAIRGVRSGKEYDQLFSRPGGNDKVIKKDAQVSHTVKFIQDKTPEICWQTKKFAKQIIKGKSLNEKCSQVWHFLYNHIPYKKDEDGVEQVRSPRRSWYDRDKENEKGEVGIDCDCFTVFISSILHNLGIPHKYRITKYEKKAPEVPRWQHIYVVVPKDGKLDYELDNREDYIVLDCVKDNFDEEEPYLEYKDYDMRLDFLDGLDGEKYEAPTSIDAQALLSALDDEELGKLKFGQFVKQARQKVGKVIRTINKVANPATILIRNAFLLAMKVNLMNIAKRIRYAYLSDQKASAMGMNLAQLAKLRKVKDKAEKIYWQVGGKKENLKLAILKGKGNKDNKVSLSGLSGLDDVYADMDEYHIINGLGELGVAPAAGGFAAAMPFLTALATALKEIKGLFPKGTKQDVEMSTEKDPDESKVTFTTEQIMAEDISPAQNTQSQQANSGASQNIPVITYQDTQNTSSTTNNNTEVTTTDKQDTTQVDTSNQNKQPVKEGFFQKAGAWVKENPGKSTLIGVGFLAGAYFLTRPKTVVNVNGVEGTPEKTKHKPKTKKKDQTPKLSAIKIK